MPIRDVLASTALLAALTSISLGAGERTTAEIGIVLVNSATLSGRQLRAISTEAAAIWRPYGIGVGWLTTDQQSQDVRIIVRLPVSPPEKQTAGALARPLGSVLFVNGIPDGVVTIRPEVVEAVTLAAGWNGRPLSDMPRALREDLAGRAIGRVLAHELGHYLLSQRGHAPRGLMRASFKGTELVAVDRRAFRLRSAEVAALGPRLAELTAAARARRIPVRVSSVSLCRAAHFCPGCPVCFPQGFDQSSLHLRQDISNRVTAAPREDRVGLAPLGGTDCLSPRSNRLA